MAVAVPVVAVAVGPGVVGAGVTGDGWGIAVAAEVGVGSGACDASSSKEPPSSHAVAGPSPGETTISIRTLAVPGGASSSISSRANVIEDTVRLASTSRSDAPPSSKNSNRSVVSTRPSVAVSIPAR
jgi:hypothetical protein